MASGESDDFGEFHFDVTTRIPAHEFGDYPQALIGASKCLELAITTPPTPLVRSAHHGGFFSVPAKKYTKPALSIDQQIAQLQQRGMTFGDPKRATHYLRELNYYRLSGYWLRREADHATHQFQPGTAFEDVLADYVFDRELKLLVLDAVERVEVSVRTHWAHHLGLRHGAHAQLDSTLFKERSQNWNHPAAVATLINGVEQSRERFIKHLRSTDRKSVV